MEVTIIFPFFSSFLFISAGRLFERHSLSDAAASHSIQRTVQPGKCSHCDSISLLNSLQCSVCSLVWHKACFPQVSTHIHCFYFLFCTNLYLQCCKLKITVSCGHQTARRTNSDRRMSIFGVNLETHLKFVLSSSSIVNELIVQRRTKIDSFHYREYNQ